MSARSLVEVPGLFQVGELKKFTGVGDTEHLLIKVQPQTHIGLSLPTAIDRRFVAAQALAHLAHLILRDCTERKDGGTE